jgi:hypothetical protein
MNNKEVIQNVWTQTVSEAKRVIVATNLWRALEKTVPVTWEDNIFVVGIEGVEGIHMAAIQSREHQMQIENVLRQISGNATVRFRLIEGNTLEDWEYAKARDAAVVAAAQQTIQRQAAESTSFGSWADIYEQVGGLWSRLPNRSFATSKAAFIEQALDILVEASGKLYPNRATEPNELGERGLSRVLERVGSYTGTDAVLIGYLLLQRLK